MGKIFLKNLLPHLCMFKRISAPEKALLRQPILILFPFGNAVLLRKPGQLSNLRFVAWPLDLG